MAAGKKRQSHRTIFLDPSEISGDKWHGRQGKRMCRSNYESSGPFLGPQKSSDPFNCAASGALHASSVLQEFTLSLDSRVEFLTTEGISSLYGQLVPGISKRGSTFRSPPMRFNSPLLLLRPLVRFPFIHHFIRGTFSSPRAFPSTLFSRGRARSFLFRLPRTEETVSRPREETRSRIEKSSREVTKQRIATSNR